MRAPLALLAVLPLCAQNWPGFRGPMSAGVADGMNPPVQWDAVTGAGLAWKTPIPGLSVSSPIVWGERVFVVTSISSNPASEFRHGLYGDVEPAKDQSEHVWKVYCLDKTTGRIVWERVAHKGVPRTKRHPKASFSSPTPVTNGQVVVAWFGSEGLFAYDMKGNLLWKKDLGAIGANWFFDPDFEWGAASSPQLWRNLVLIQADQSQGSFLAAFEWKTGREVWRVQRDELPSWGTPVVFEHEGQSILVTNATKMIRANDPATGRLLWEMGRNSEITCTTPVFAHGLVFVANGYPPVQPIYAIRFGARGDLTLPEGKESSDAVAWSKLRGGPYQPSPLVYGDRLYLVSNNGVLTAYAARSGERLFQERVAGKGGAFSASPVAADGRLYLTAEDGEVHVVKIDGAKPETLGSNPMGEVLMATPAIARGMLIVRGMKHVFAVRGR